MQHVLLAINSSPQKHFLINVKTLVCSDRILTCRIKSIRSPAKVGLVVTDLITSPVVSWRGCETPPPVPRLSCHSLLNHGSVRTSLFVVACCCRLLGFVYIGGWTWTFFLDISFEYFLSFLLVYIKNYTDLPRGVR